jgi:hypothetical protein
MFIKVELEAHNIVFFEHAITDLDRIANILLFIFTKIGNQVRDDSVF